MQIWVPITVQTVGLRKPWWELEVLGEGEGWGGPEGGRIWPFGWVRRGME